MAARKALISSVSPGSKQGTVGGLAVIRPWSAVVSYATGCGAASDSRRWLYAMHARFLTLTGDAWGGAVASPTARRRRNAARKPAYRGWMRDMPPNHGAFRETSGHACKMRTRFIAMNGGGLRGNHCADSPTKPLIPNVSPESKQGRVGGGHRQGYEASCQSASVALLHAMPAAVLHRQGIDGVPAASGAGGAENGGETAF